MASRPVTIRMAQRCPSVLPSELSWQQLFWPVPRHLCGTTELNTAPSVLHGPYGPQAEQDVVAGNQCQIHDQSRGGKKPVGRIAVR